MTEHAQDGMRAEGKRARRERTDRLAWRAVQGLLILSAGQVLVSLLVDHFGRWSIWKQGDWLINSINGPVRRGPVGSAVIHVSDALHLSPVTTIIGLQVVLCLVLYGSFYLALRALHDPRLALLLTSSSAMFVTFWPANIYHGALRKELLGMTALAVLLVYARSGRPWALVAAAAPLLVGVWAHEIVILFVPAFILVAWRATKGSRALVVPVLGLVVVSAVLAGWYTLAHVSAPSIASVCQPLLERGLDDRICSGPLRWVTEDGNHTMGLVRARNATPSGLLTFGVAGLAAVAPLVYLAALVKDRTAVVVAVLAAVPFGPLFLIVIDWGRWLSCGVFAFAAVLLAQGVGSGLTLRRRPSGRALAAFVALALVVAPFHVNGLVWGGILSHAYDLARSVVALG
jgi:hypothetical protein